MRARTSARIVEKGDSLLVELAGLEYPDGLCPLSETCGPKRYLGYSGTATGMIGKGRIPLAFGGVVRLWGSQSPACSGDHQAVFVK